MTDTTSTMVTATYTDPTTGWQQRVEVGEAAVGDPATADEWVWIRGTGDDLAKVPGTTLRDFHREQGDSREYLAPTRYCHEAGCSRSTTPHLWDPEMCPAVER